MNGTAELRTHWPLADRGAEDQPDALFNLLLARDQGDAAGGVGSQREGPAGPDEFFAHCAITFVWPAEPIIMGAPVGTQVPPTGGSPRRTGIPPTSTFVLPDGMMPLMHGPLATGGGGNAQPAITYDAGMVTTG